MVWKAIKCKATGTSHKKRGIPCQDYVDYYTENNSNQITGNLIIGAVADGAGSAKYSQFGAELAVKTTLNKLKSKSFEQQISQEQAEQIFAETLKDVQTAFNKEAKERSCSLKDLACTLLVFIATPNWLAAMQIGDGFIVARFEEEDYQLLFSSDKGEYANETIFVISPNVKDSMHVRVLPGNCKFVCASTDGLERLAIILSEAQPFDKFFRPLEEGLKQTKNLEDEQKQIQAWIESDQVNNRTDDDKTLLMCVYEEQSSLEKTTSVAKEKPEDNNPSQPIPSSSVEDIKSPSEEKPGDNNSSQPTPDSSDKDTKSPPEEKPGDNNSFEYTPNSSDHKTKKVFVNYVRFKIRYIMIISFFYYILVGYLLGVASYLLPTDLFIFSTFKIVLGLFALLIALPITFRSSFQFLNKYIHGKKKRKKFILLTTVIVLLEIMFGVLLSVPVHSPT